MMRGDGDVVAGWKNKIKTSIASVTPAGWLAEMHRREAEPGTGRGSGSGAGQGALAAMVVGAAVMTVVGVVLAQHRARGPRRWS
jgi:hypothetical protein